MKADPLENAISALRERYDGQSDAASTSEDAIIHRMRQKTRQRQRARLAIPIAALLAASSAWATRNTLSESVRQVGAWLRHEPPQSSGPAPVRGQPPDRSEKPAPPKASLSGRQELTPSDPVSTPASTPNTSLPERSSPPAKPRAAPSALSNAAPTFRAQNAPFREPGDHSLPKPDPMLLYREAHRLHFIEKDPGRALLAWDRYLARGGQADFAVEARYNRAICLWRLGRTAEAQSELRPFARGDYGGYRQTEAAALLSTPAVPRPSP